MLYCNIDVFTQSKQNKLDVRISDKSPDIIHVQTLIMYSYISCWKIKYSDTIVVGDCNFGYIYKRQS